MTTPRILLAPDSFKGTMSAAMVAEALAEGVLEAGGLPDVCPVADGGEGTLEALRAAVGGRDMDHTVTGPDGREVHASYLLSDDGRLAVVETAAASGLHLIDPTTVDAYTATSAGTGQLIAAAAGAGARTILVGVGGSGFSDGGAGALQAIRAAGGLGDAHLTVLCDVTNTYLEAATVFAPQKGADPETVHRLTARLRATATGLPHDPTGVPRTGAAGGLAGALWATFDADLVSGIDTVLGQVNFAERVARADAVITGEGRLDDQTAHGKVVSGVVRWTGPVGIPVYAVVGQCTIDHQHVRELGLAAASEAGDPVALRAAAASITTQLRSPASPVSTKNQEVNT